MQYQRTWQDALKALYEYGFLWTNPIEAPDHTSQEIGSQLVSMGYAEIAHRGKGYERLEITHKGIEAVGAMK